MFMLHLQIPQKNCLFIQFLSSARIAVSNGVGRKRRSPLHTCLRGSSYIDNCNSRQRFSKEGRFLIRLPAIVFVIFPIYLKPIVYFVSTKLLVFQSHQSACLDIFLFATCLFCARVIHQDFRSLEAKRTWHLFILALLWDRKLVATQGAS